MKKRTFALAGLCVLFLTACSPKAAAPAEEAEKKEAKPQGVAISSEEAEHIGLQISAVRDAKYAQTVSGYGVVVGLDTVAQLQADIATASAAATESSAALARAQALSRGNNAAIARREVDAAVHAAATDSAALGLAQRKNIAMFGKDAPWLRGRAGILADLTSGRLALVRASFTIGALPAGNPPSLTMTPLNQNEAQAGVNSNEIWAAPADPAIPGRSFYALVDGKAFAEGERLTVRAPAGGTADGVLVPADAVLLSDNAAYYYAKANDGSYVRRPLDLSSPLPGGYFVKNAKPGENVVTAGAGLVLARELNPSTEVEE